MTALISLRDIRKHYGGDKGVPRVDVLKGISLDIQAGEFIAIVGASGSGKSTLMHILGCLDRPVSGQYLFAGQDVATLDDDALAALRREAFGFVFQAYHLIATESARENVEIPAVYAGLPEQERRRRSARLLSRLGLAERMDNRPNQLSGGQQQRVSIARALINGGSVILADEPTGALDSASGTEVMALLTELADQGHTIILITHDYKVAAQARRVVEMSDGNIIADSGSAQPPEQSRGVQPASLPSVATGQSPSLPGELLDACRAAWRVMWANRFRTLLTLLGIIIGVMSVIVMLAVGEGAKQQVIRQMNNMGPNMIYVGSRSPVTGGPLGVLTSDDFAIIEALPEVLQVMPILRDPALIRHGEVSQRYEVLATSEIMPQIHRWPVQLGRFYTAEENREIAPVVVLGHQVWQTLFPNGDNPLGSKILVQDAPYEVVGVMSEKGADSGNNSPDRQVFMPHQTGVVRLFPKLRDESYATIEVVNSHWVKAAEDKIRNLLLQRHGREDFWVNNAGARLQAEMSTRNSMTLMLGLIAAISLVVGGIGVMNVMLMTVRERTREIGIRVATGARQTDILRQFITESALISLLGGMAGAGLSLLILLGLRLADVAVAPSLVAFAGAILCALATGLLFGFMPARQAARLDPVVALAGD